MSNETLRTGELARRAGVNVQTLRYYERRGLLKAPRRRESGYREYTPEAVKLIRFIKGAQDLGFTLAEIDELIALRNGSGPRDEVRRLAAAKLADIEKKIQQLQSMRQALSQLVQTCACATGTLECPILEALDDDQLRRRLHVTP
jgi:Hg(II)-responsive transcriptional regulator